MSALPPQSIYYLFKKEFCLCQLIDQWGEKVRKNQKCQNGIYVSEVGIETTEIKGKGKKLRNSSRQGDGRNSWFKIKTKYGEVFGVGSERYREHQRWGKV